MHPHRSIIHCPNNRLPAYLDPEGRMASYSYFTFAYWFLISTTEHIYTTMGISSSATLAYLSKDDLLYQRKTY